MLRSTRRQVQPGAWVYRKIAAEDAYHANLQDYAHSLARPRELPVRTMHGGHFLSFSGEHLNALIDNWFRAHG